ncbi:indole-3-glycerol phosphate synthase TrpC [bacterium]|nr:indole-3-glycerol phosphate synthase TrpC [bacterium]
MSILQKILNTKRQEVDLKKKSRPLSVLEAGLFPARRGFRQAVRRNGVSIIAEIKRRSPSSGMIRADADPGGLAALYERSGAAAISVLTDSLFFGGDDSFIPEVRTRSALPVLRKEFILDSYQITESAALGADAVLLLANVLDGSRIDEFIDRAGEYGMDCLVEVHTEEELRSVLRTRASLISINNRDLATFDVDLDTSLRLKPLIPDERVSVSASGLRGPDDIRRLCRAGFHAALVGETLMRSGNIPEMLASLLEAGEP